MARKLYRASATIETFILVEEGEEFNQAAALVVQSVKDNGLEGCDDLRVVPVEDLEEVPEEWRSSIPYSDLDEDDELHDLTCSEFLAQSVPSEDEDDDRDDDEDEAEELDFS